TWVPFDRGVALANQYHVQTYLQPLFDFVPTDKSPPLAPKHITAASLRPRKPREPRVPGQAKPRKRKAKDKADLTNTEEQSSQVSYSELESDLTGSGSGMDTDDVEVGEEDSDVSIPDEHMRSEFSSVSQTPSPVDSEDGTSDGSDGSDAENRPHREIGLLLAPPSSHKRRKHHHRRHRRRERERGRGAGEEGEEGEELGGMERSHYAQVLLEYFVSDSQQIPPVLVRPPPDLDINLIIDEEGHTCLHWASAMARMNIVSTLILNHADIYRVNYNGQTALMRSVLFTNNFDNKTFPQLLDLLQKTIFNIDRYDQTVFHHVAITASSKGKVHASRYYMDCLLDKLRHVPAELVSILNVQDVVGDTALVIAARIANKKLVKSLLDSGADPNIRNRTGKTAQDYIVEADRLARSRLKEGVEGAVGVLGGVVAQGVPGSPSQAAMSPFKVVPTVTRLFENLSTSYEKDMTQREEDLKDARSVHTGILAELQETRKAIAELQEKEGGLAEARSKIGELEDRLRDVINGKQMRRLKRLVEEEERRSGVVGGLTGGLSPSLPPTTMAPMGDAQAQQEFLQAVLAQATSIQGEPSAAAAATAAAASSEATGGGAGGEGEPNAGAASGPIKPPTPPLQIKEETRDHPFSSAFPISAPASSSASSSASSAFPPTSLPPPTESSSYPSISPPHHLAPVQPYPHPPHLLPPAQLTAPPLIPGPAIPTSSDGSSSPRILALEHQAVLLREQLAQLQSSRRALVEDIVRLSGQAGQRHADYKHLIALCCGVPVEGVDTLLNPLLEALAAEETYT
ncbi:hypothetical protein BC938DRAFT_475070, partial [Jimgerdemannia flammicorona]